ncbi:MAG: ATP-binding protein [Candidatus Accumulibacter phosphatis]|jgi:hypothetical protein
MTSNQIPEIELASYRFKLKRIQRDELPQLLETLLQQGRLTESLAPDIAEAIERGASRRLTSELLSKVIAATNSKRIFDAGRETLNLCREEWYRFVGLIDDEDVEKQLVEIIYDHVSNGQTPTHFLRILDALVERGSHRSIEVIQVLIYELDPKLQSANVVFDSVKDQISEESAPQEFGNILYNRWLLQFHVERLRAALAALKVRLDATENKESSIDQQMLPSDNTYVDDKNKGMNGSWRQAPEPGDVFALIKRGEGPHLEFKSTLRVSLPPKQDTPQYVIEGEVLKTVCGFLNKDGGELVIGVTDNGECLGIEADKFKNLDEFQKHFSNLMRTKIGIQFYAAFVFGHVVPIQDKHVFYVKCIPSDQKVFAKVKKKKDDPEVEEFFVRTGSQTERLEGTRLPTTHLT